MRSWVLLAVLTSACNQVLGLDPTQLPPPDEDGDGVADPDGGCPTVPDPDQADADQDGFGDACDRCPGLRTERNHDEDGDRQGDECDRCPVAPDFGEDFDGDGVGDLCEFATTPVPTRLAWFDPFVALAPSLRSAGVAWVSADDAIVPVATPPSDDPGLVVDALEVTTALFRISVGAISARSWTSGDQVGIGLVDDDGPVATCRIICTAAECRLALRVRDGFTGDVTIVPRPLVDVRLAQLSESRVACFTDAVAIAGTAPPLVGRVVLHGSPALPVSYRGVWTEGP